MAFKIGFSAEETLPDSEPVYEAPGTVAAPRKSVVQVLFADKGIKLSYYNDQFDLHCGDIVFVEGKLEGQRGHVVEVSYNFKIKVSEYKRVIAVAETDVHGQFFMADSHFVTFDPNTLPPKKIATWFMPPKNDDDFVSGSDDSSFCLSDLSVFKVSEQIAERGYNYYTENRVVYICVNGTEGYAIVEGSVPYEVEFNYIDGEISGLVCSCFCGFNCKHEVATMLQLCETLELIEKNYAAEYESTGYFAAVKKSTLFIYTIDSRENGSFAI